MRNKIYIMFVLAFQIAFSQVDVFKKSNQIKLFEIDENKKTDMNLFTENSQFKFGESENNTEKKFTLTPDNKKYFSSQVSLLEANISKSIDSKDNSSKTIISKTKEDFVRQIIREKITKEIQNYISLNEALNYGDKNTTAYKDYASQKNRLIKIIRIDKDFEVQIGKDIIPYLNKILKTEIDKTQQNSINLFAINF